MLKLFVLKSTNLQCQIRVVCCNDYELQPMLEHFAKDTRDLIIADKLCDVNFENAQYSVELSHVNEFARSRDYRETQHETTANTNTQAL